jgi:hypothetical protein
MGKPVFFGELSPLGRQKQVRFILTVYFSTASNARSSRGCPGSQSVLPTAGCHDRDQLVVLIAEPLGRRPNRCLTGSGFHSCNPAAHVPAAVVNVPTDQQTRRGWSGEKRRPICGERRSLPLSHPSPPLLPDLPSPSLPAQGGEGGRERCSTIVWVAGFQ